jgi:hypothetical protein
MDVKATNFDDKFMYFTENYQYCIGKMERCDNIKQRLYF